MFQFGVYRRRETPPQREALPHFTHDPNTCRSECDLEDSLHPPRRISWAPDVAKSGGGHVVRRSAPAHSIEHIECFAAERQADAFANRKVLGERDVLVKVPRRAKLRVIARRVTELRIQTIHGDALVESSPVIPLVRERVEFVAPDWRAPVLVRGDEHAAAGTDRAETGPDRIRCSRFVTEESGNIPVPKHSIPNAPEIQPPTLS